MSGNTWQLTERFALDILVRNGKSGVRRETKLLASTRIRDADNNSYFNNY